MEGPDPLAVTSDAARVVARLRAAGCVFAEAEAELLLADAAAPEDVAESVRRRVSGTPLEHILGWAEFAGQRILVESGVFVPRRRTELLVGEAMRLLSFLGTSQSPLVVDLCCGSGAVGAVLGHRVPEIELHAADIDPLAVRCAWRNVLPVGGTVHEGDLFDALPARLRGRVQVLAVNAPYVPTEAIRTMPPEARIHEPRISLDGGGDGLEFHRRVAAEASEWLSPDGHVLVETSRRQAAATSSILAAAGLAVRTACSEELDATAVIASRHA